jgi:hypothetical protein
VRCGGDDGLEGIDFLRGTRAVDVIAVQAADPVAEEGAATHAFGVGEEVEGGGSIWGAGFLDVDYFLAGRDGAGGVREADFAQVLFFGVAGLARKEGFGGEGRGNEGCDDDEYGEMHF